MNALLHELHSWAVWSGGVRVHHVQDGRAVGQQGAVEAGTEAGHTVGGTLLSLSCLPPLV